MILEGTVLRGRSFEPVEGRVVVENGVIDAVEECKTQSDDIIAPAFVNAHTHIGDSIAKEAGEGLSLEELVAPPDGLKHELLAAADRNELIAAMRRTVSFMESTGTAAFIDFREGDVEGVRALQEASATFDVEAVVLGRESVEALQQADGFGASGANDGNFSSFRAEARDANKLFAIHAGEVDSSDVNQALDLEPDFVVHMVHAEDLHLERIEDSHTPVVVCPRSNLTTDVGIPPVRDLLDRTTVALGTDNVMLNSPSMFREMALTATVCDVSPVEVLQMATINGAEIAGLPDGVIAEGKTARLQVLDGDSDNLAGAIDPVKAIVNRAGMADVSEVLLGHP